MQYDFRSIEKNWQAYWDKHQTFRTPNPADSGFDPFKPKFYVLDMFPYPSGVGLHVGHPLGYIATDIVARFKRMEGFNVLHPMGYDAFGLPAEQFAVENGVHPRVTTEQNIANMTRQLKQLGLSYDWDRCLSTTDVDYYKWTQWIFLQLYNSYFDKASNKARPISHLVMRLESEELTVGIDNELVEPSSIGLDAVTGTAIGTRKWFELTNDERNELIDDMRLAYLAEVPVNWCPALGTVLANEEVTNEGRSDRGNHPVFKRPLKQWLLRITEYADRLIDELALVEWPESIKMMQRNWIGKSTGAYVEFAIDGNEDAMIEVFTTRPDTLFGATYMVLAPEHVLADSLTTPQHAEAAYAYRKAAAGKSERERMADVRPADAIDETPGVNKGKTGVFTGSYAINPVNGRKIPIWIADYVMVGYGTGAIMAVPAHDQRDHDFAVKYNLPIERVIAAPAGAIDVQEKAWTDGGELVNSANDEIDLNGLPMENAKSSITRWLESSGLGRPAVQYKLRDWLFSRQRYWGEPFPILHGPDGEIVAVDESELPVELPEMADFRPTASEDPDAKPQPPLARAPDSWKYVVRNGVRYTREFNTMPQWAGSCWYYLRFADNHNHHRFVGELAERYWMSSTTPSERVSERAAMLVTGAATPEGVDLYVGGAEHAVLHLLYSRFWHKVLFDLGHVSAPEPFGRLFNQGYIQAYAYTDARGMYVPAENVEEKDGKYLYEGQELKRHFGKMGKSLKNAVAPDEICEAYGCDTLRLYEMSMGPLDQSKVWNTRDIIGMHRFLQRVWRNFVNEQTGALLVLDQLTPDPLERLLHKTIKRVTDAMNAMSFNVAIAALIELNNELVGKGGVPRGLARAMVLMLAPLAPHVAEELWQKLGHDKSLAYEKWPTYDPQLLVKSTIEYPVQVNGKLRGRVTVPADADDAAIQAAALADEKIQAAVAGKSVRKAILVKGKLLNLVIG
jgi:leucyl-tRNA synthetase